MTIAAGFLCRDGVLLCSDSQYTGWDKSQKDKVFCRLFGSGTIGFAFAGNETYCRNGIEDVMAAVMSLSLPKQTLLSVRDAIHKATAKVINDYASKKYLDQSQRPEFLIGIGTREDSHLYVARDTALAPVDHFESCGTGGYLAAHFIKAAVRFTRTLSVEDVFPVAFRALSAAKQHDAFCGGGSQFLVVRGGPYAGSKIGFSCRGYNSDESDVIVGRFEQHVANLFSSFCNIHINPEVFSQSMDLFEQEVSRLRESLMASLPYRGLVESFTQEVRLVPPKTTDDPSPPPPWPELPGGSGES
ncbi:MAG: hypothetical protein ABSH47_26080 [Bryobacteraceae bacterium]|jgi:20S proteasome alpha/beta subunit